MTNFTTLHHFAHGILVCITTHQQKRLFFITQFFTSPKLNPPPFGSLAPSRVKRSGSLRYKMISCNSSCPVFCWPLWLHKKLKGSCNGSGKRIWNLGVFFAEQATFTQFRRSNFWVLCSNRCYKKMDQHSTPKQLHHLSTKKCFKNGWHASQVQTV